MNVFFLKDMENVLLLAEPGAVFRSEPGAKSRIEPRARFVTIRSIRIFVGNISFYQS